MSFIGQAYPDNATLYSGTISTAVTSTISTAGYMSAVIQLSGSDYSGIITIDGSSDGNYWSPLLVTRLSSLSLVTQLDISGSYEVKLDCSYMKFTIQKISGTASLIIVGNNHTSSNTVDKLALAMDADTNTPLNVRFQGGIKLDPNLAIVQSDAPVENRLDLALNAFVVIDTTGYNSLSITTQTMVASFTTSNDGITYVALNGNNLFATPGSFGATLGINASMLLPCLCRYIKITATTAGVATYYLRSVAQAAYQVNGSNIAQIAGSTPVSGGIAGSFAVGASSGIGAISNYNPLLIAGGDPAGLTRKLTMDQSGKLFAGNPVIPNGVASPTQAITALTGFNNQIPLNVQDTAQSEGQSTVEILLQILTELKVLNQQMYELPRIMSSAQGISIGIQAVPMVQLGDEPTVLRNDPAIINS